MAAGPGLDGELLESSPEPVHGDQGVGVLVGVDTHDGDQDYLRVLLVPDQ